VETRDSVAIASEDKDIGKSGSAGEGLAGASCGARPFRQGLDRPAPIIKSHRLHTD
jgi:hypothetical protein